MRYLLMDANSILNRAFYGIRPLTTSSGTNTNAVYGFLSILNKHLKTYAPCAVCAAFDRKEKTYRHEMYSGYKAGRKKMPDELAEQFPIIKNILSEMNIKCIEQPGLEADDIIGTLSRKLAENGGECIIITGDRDSFQLINSSTTVCLAGTKDDVVYDEASIKEKYGLLPEQLKDLKALMGDSSDNIPGVPGVGEKTACSLLIKYGTLESVFEHKYEAKGALKDKLINGEDSAFMSRSLGTITTDAHLPKEADSITEPSFDSKKLVGLFTELEMSSMIKRFSLSEQLSEAEQNTVINTNIVCCDDIPNTDDLYMVMTDDFLFIKADDGIRKCSITENILSKASKKNIYTHDAKPIIRRFLKSGFEPVIKFDTMLAAYILNPSLPSYPLETLAENDAGSKTDSKENAVYFLDTLCVKLNEKLINNGQADLYYNIELPLCKVLAKMENDGFTVDGAFLSDFGKSIEGDISAYTEAIYLYAGKEFNINSTKQLGDILFNELHFPVIRKTKTGFSTDNDVLEELFSKTQDPVIQNIIDYRKLIKLRSTYVDGLISKIESDGRIHTVFTQTVTQTGRISSTEPNLQNIPVRTQLGRELRKAFVARDGYTLIDADYSQIELRVLADIAQDKNMADAFINNKDIHTITASQVFGIPENMITSELRRRAKAVNFGIVYGIGEYSLSRDIGVSVKEARRYIESYFETYGGVHEYMQRIIETARETGYVETKFGRRRYVPDINAKNYQIRTFSERVCRNTPIQGTAADIIKLAMVNVSDKLKKTGTKAKLLLQVHDELIIEAPENECEEIGKILKNEMENAVKLSVPLTADVGYGKNWFDAKK